MPHIVTAQRHAVQGAQTIQLVACTVHSAYMFIHMQIVKVDRTWGLAPASHLSWMVEFALIG